MAILDKTLRQETCDRYLTYALSVVSNRALPDVRDGLKPVQRRILYTMMQILNLRPGGSHKKSATVIGAVLGNFHPHGDIPCYEAMVQMSQDFSLRYPLLDGEGNFGSLDGDGAAAYRYTEVKLRPLALEVIGEIGEETVDFVDNFDSSRKEPTVLPSRVPNLLINGVSGIAVGMATSIPPHNLRDTISALIELLENRNASVSRLATVIKGPDFPTGCLLLNTRKELCEMYESGRGQVCMRAVWEIEELQRGKQAVIITAIPYAVNKALLVEKVADLIVARKVPQLVDVRDESTDQVRVVLELAAGADPEAAVNYLFKNTPLQSQFAVNLTALVPTGGKACRPELLSLKDILGHFLDFRIEVVIRRLQFEMKNLLERLHILEGFVKIFDDLDAAIRIVRSSSGRSDAAEKLAKRFKLSDAQAFAIVDLRIYQLSRTNIDEIRKELRERRQRLNETQEILKSKKKIGAIVKSELEQISQTYGDRRRCSIVRESAEVEINQADYVVQEDVYAIVTADGWLKRIRQSNELNATRVREGDSIRRAHAASTLDALALFTNLGYLYVLPITDIPSSSGYGSPVQKLLKFRDEEKIIESFVVFAAGANQKSLVQEARALQSEQTVVLVSKRGVGCALKLESLEGLKKNGKRVAKLRQNDHLAAVCSLDSRVAFFTQGGSALEVKKSEIPVRTQPGVGVALMGVRPQDMIIGCVSYGNNSASVRLFSDSGRFHDVSAGKLCSGRRGLKGSKAAPRAGR